MYVGVDGGASGDHLRQLQYRYGFLLLKRSFILGRHVRGGADLDIYIVGFEF